MSTVSSKVLIHWIVIVQALETVDDMVKLIANQTAWLHLNVILWIKKNIKSWFWSYTSNLLQDIWKYFKCREIYYVYLSKHSIIYISTSNGYNVICFCQIFDMTNDILFTAMKQSTQNPQVISMDQTLHLYTNGI